MSLRWSLSCAGRSSSSCDAAEARSAAASALLPRTLNPVSYPTFLKLLNGKVLSLGWLPTGASYGVVAALGERLFGCSADLFHFRERSDSVASGGVLRVALRLRGGKGGFGSLLKGKNSTQKTVNFDACKTRDGTRVRHQRQLEALQRWAEGDDDADETTRLSSNSGMLTHSEVRKRKNKHSSMLRNYDNAVTPKEAHAQKMDEKERRVKDGCAALGAETAGMAEQIKAAVFKAGKKRKAGDQMSCPEGHELTELVVGKKGSKTTGFDYNVCDECDEQAEKAVFRCQECDYDVCSACKCVNHPLATASEPAEAEAAAPAKKKKKKSGGFGHDLDVDSSDE